MNDSIIFRSLSLLSKRDQGKIVSISLIQFFMALMDLISIAIIGLIASITLFGIQSRNLPDNVSALIRLLRLDSLAFQTQVAILGFVAGVLLILKSVISAYISRRILFFLNQKTATTTATLLGKILAQPYDYIKTRVPAEILFSLTRGVNALISGILGSASQIATELSLLIIVFCGLLFFDTPITFFCFLYFGLIAYFQTRRLRAIAEQSQSQSAKALVKSDSKILDSLNLYRELHVRNARSPQIEQLIKTRIEMADFNSRVLFLPYITKYTMEVALVLGAVILFASQFLLKDAISALATLSVFLVAATRVTPAILRLQQALIRYKASVGDSSRTISMMAELQEYNQDSYAESSLADSLYGEIRVSNLRFRYRDAINFAIKGVSFTVDAGETVAIVGPSGNGKSTLIDLLMGALVPDSGRVQIENLSPRSFVLKHPGKIGYVAQESIFIKSSIRENLLIGLESKSIEDCAIWEALKLVGLDELVKGMPEKLDTSLGERGLKLSTGQRQRLSLARAILTKPRFLFLDEPTSALDDESEKKITELIDSLRGATTIVIVAHRIETIRRADKVMKMVDGEIVSVGTFEQVFT